MSNDLTDPNKANLPSAADLVSNLTNVKDTVSNADSGGVPILKFSGKNGSWTVGAERIEPSVSAQFAVDPYTFMHGWIAWENMEPVGEVMRSSSEPLPNRNELPDYGTEWQLQNSVIMKCVAGELDEVGMTVIQKGSSMGHAKMIRELTSQIINYVNADPDNKAIYPIVELKYDSYMNKKHGGETFNPIMEIVDWMTYDQIMAGEGNEEPEPTEPEPAPKPAAETKRRQRRGGNARARRRTG